MDKAILTCALNGVLTDPKRHSVPVTPEELGLSARQAFDEGASVFHIHFRDQREGMGHMPTWDPAVAKECVDAIRQACPGALINQSTGVVGPDVSGPIACMAAVQPELAACNAGSLNYLKTRRDGSWAWPPMLFDNPVAKIQKMLDAMALTDTIPEFECFDLGILRSVGLYLHNGMAKKAQVNFVMGVASGMPLDVELMELLLKYKPEGSPWQATLIGRQQIWPLHRRAAELGGMLRTGLEDTFYGEDGEKVSSNAALIRQLAVCARDAGREVASPAEARVMMGITH
jgi:uncharacterized protein (DUF849 family)